MIRRWILYLFLLICFIAFYIAYQEWAAWILLVAMLALPWFSLLISIVPMLCVRPKPDLPGALIIGSPETLKVDVQGVLPLPPYRCQFRWKHNYTGKSKTDNPGASLPTEHCGMITVESQGFFAEDFLGLFSIRLLKIPTTQILIRPRPISVKIPKNLDRLLSQSWKPKYGGGFAENHEHRLYQPGDSMNQIHWKLTAKTGKYIVREAMTPQHGLLLLTLSLSGKPEILDYKLGKFLYLGQYLLEKELQFALHAQTGDGLLKYTIHSKQELQNALDDLLRSSPIANEATLSTGASIWHYHIGGDADES